MARERDHTHRFYENLTLFLRMIAGYLLVLAMFLSEDAFQPDEIVGAEGRVRYVTGIDSFAARVSLAQQVFILAVATAVAAIVIGLIKLNSAKEAFEATVGSIVIGGLVGFVTAFPLRLYLSLSTFWLVVGPLYAVAVIVAIWVSSLLARRGRVILS